MSTDSQGRPLSDDGQWAWNGTEWVPAAGGPAGAEPAATAGAGAAEDVGATMIVQSPFPGGVPGAPQAATPPAGYGQAQGYGQPAFEQQGYGQVPGYGPGAPGYGVPPQTQQKSRKPLILGAVGVLVIAAVVVILILTLGGSSKKDPTGAFKCSAPGTTQTVTLTFQSGHTYSLSQGGTGGAYTRKGDVLTFTSGDVKPGKGTISNGGKTITVTGGSVTVTCKK